MTDINKSFSEIPSNAVAIIGIGCRVPDALSTPVFWQNILDGHSAISEVPRDRWNPDLYWDEDRNAPDKTYSKIGGWVKGFEFGRKKYRLPPMLVESMDPTQTLCLEAVHEALEDSGYLEKDFDRERCAVILGNAMGGDLRDRTNLRVFYAEIERAVRMTLLESVRAELSEQKIEQVLDTLGQRFRDPLPRVTEDSMPGELANVVAGRVAALFNLRGPNFTTDAACASSLAAVNAAVHGLQAGQYDLAISGGIDRCMGAPTFVKFAKIGALSPDGSRPFDASANGFVMGEGGAMLVMKRLSDAQRDGDKTYAVIRGIGASSDGKGKGITAPNPIGQKLALKRAYQDAGYGPRAVSLFEAHGTSTPVGDPIEVNSLISTLSEDGGAWAAEHVGIGSIKSMIGHLKAGAGAVSLAKAALALKERTLPPSINLQTPNPAIEFGRTPLRVQTRAERWETLNGAPRRAGVSAFGFGGTNFHITLEEFDPDRPTGISVPGFNADAEATAHNQTPGLSSAHASSEQSTSEQKVSDIFDGRPPQDGILMFIAENEAEIQAEFAGFARDFEQNGLKACISRRLQLESGDFKLPDAPTRLAVSYADEEGLKTQIARIEKAFSRGRGWKILANQGIFLSDERLEGRLAMLFPGQGSQYIGMLGALKERYPLVQATFDEADQIMQPILGRTLSSIIFPTPEDLSEEAANELLRQTEVTQPAVLTVDIALLRLFEQFGLTPDMVAGHSLGEYGAAVAAGVMSFADALRTVAARGTQMARAVPPDADKGLMASIPAPADEVRLVLDTIDGYVVCANINCPKQTIIAGASDAVRKAVAIFEARGLMVHILNVSHAFHTEVVAAASLPLREHLNGIAIQTPTIPILTNVTGGFYPKAPDEIRELMARQLASPVEYIKLTEEMYAAGARVFIEVGPKRTQSTFVSSTLGERAHLATYSNHPKEGDVVSLHNILARLWVAGVWTQSDVAITQSQLTSKKTDTPTISIEKQNIQKPQSPPRSHQAIPDKNTVLGTMLNVLCEKTGYDPDEIEFDFELEADLGIDTVKQAEIMADVREHFKLARDEEFRLADYPTLERMADYVIDNLSAGAAISEQESAQEQVSPSFTNADEAVPQTAETRPASAPAAPQDASVPDKDTVLGTMLKVLCEKTGYDPDEIEFDFELEADLGIDTVKQAEIMADVREHFKLARDEEFRLADYPTLERMADYVIDNLSAETTISVDAPTLSAAREVRSVAQTSQTSPTPTEQPESVAAADSRLKYQPIQHDIPAKISISGSALGLPGLDDIFDPDAVEYLLNGKNFIGDIPMPIRQEMVDKHIVRVQKHKDGGGELVEVKDVAEVIKLAGRAPGEFDLAKWGIPERMIEQFDHTSQLAIAAGINALRDAGLPLVPHYRETRSGKKLTIGWQLPQKIGEETGVIFASAFAGDDALVDEVTRRFNDPNYQFDHRFLVKVLGMANARFAEMIGAMGPNTRINNACASTTTALGMAQDWILAGRCKRVVIISADDASGQSLMEWVGSGFLATGAATTKAEVEEAALPFDKRRHGMIIGMGAVSLVVEAGGLAEARGMEPLADVLGTHFVNSAYHPTRLRVEHIAGEVGKLLGRVEGDFRFERQDIADKTVFVSHETYTPARGGSAGAEIAALRNNFGPAAAKVVVANTKGFTGHAMGAGIEDVLAIKALQKQRLPHIANFKEPDPELGDLRLSQGGDYQVDYALRLAAGFGSQLALAFLRFRARREDRVFDPARYQTWLGEISGFAEPKLLVEARTLRLVDEQPEKTDDLPETDAQDGTSAQKTEPIPAQTLSTSVQNAPTAVQNAATQSIAAGASVLDSQPEHLADSSVFEPRPVVVEAHTAIAYDIGELEAAFKDKHILLLNGPTSLNHTINRALEQCGAQVHAVDAQNDPKSGLNTVPGTHLDLLDESAILAKFKEIGRIDGIVNLLGYGQDSDSAPAIHRAARQTFHIARAWQIYLGEAPGAGHIFLSITGMGGRLGFDASTQPLPMCGAISGLTKGLGREWPEASVRVVDVARDGFYPELGLQILSQIHAESPTLEVGLIGGVRYVPVIVDAQVLGGHGSSHAYAPDAESVVVLVGGARGITAEVAVNLAERFGSKLALVGRSKLTHPDPMSIDLAAEKRLARERILATGARPTPVLINQQLRPLKAQIEIAQTLGRIQAAGAQAEYFSCDVANPDNVSVLVERIRSRFGKIDGVIHAAGVEESKFLADKDAASFDRVFVGKAVGALNLWQAIRVYEPQFFVAFSSVAGRFGNEGQVDYSAANDLLNKLVARINATTHTRALSIDWTAWDGVGMATHGSMKTILEARGVQFLPVEVGAPLVGDAMERGLTGEYLVAGALGEMGADSVIERSAMLADDAIQTHRHVFIDRILQADRDELVVERVFDPQTDYFINDHVYQGVAVLPGVMGFEFMVEAAHAFAKMDPMMGANGTGESDESRELYIREVSEIRFDHAIKFHHGEPLRAIATASVVERSVVERNAANSQLVLNLMLETSRTSKTGRELQKQHFSAQVTVGTTPADRPRPMQLDASGEFLIGPNKLEIYRRFFHTGSFQVLEEVPHLGESVVIGYGRNPTGRLSAAQNGHVFLTDPMVREMAFQTVGLWGMKHQGRSFLPMSIGRATQFGTARPGEGVCVRCLRRDDADEHAIAFDVEVLSQDGRLLQVMEKVQLIGHRVLEADEQFGQFARRRMTARRFTLPEAQLLLSDLGLSVEDILAAREEAEYTRFKSDLRRDEWLAARVAAKYLTFCHLRNFHGLAAPLGELSILKDEHGAPFVALSEALEQQLGALNINPTMLPHLTITHSAGVAIAAIAAPGPTGRAGIDLEAIEARNPAFADDYFSADERTLSMPVALVPEGIDARDTLLTTLWSIKEAVSKTLGLGLALSTAEVEIRALSAANGRLQAEIELSGRARQKLEDLSADTSALPRLEVEVELDQSFALAFAWVQLGDADGFSAQTQDYIITEVDRPATTPGAGTRLAGAQTAGAQTAGAQENVTTSEQAPQSPESWVEIAAVAALLKHKGLLGRLEADETRIKSDTISPWQQS